MLEFARAGIGNLRILDYDFVEPGSTVRWPLGLSQVGRFKTDSLRRFIEAEYPYTQVQSWTHRIGGTPDSGPGDIEVVKEITAGANLIYDATAEIGLQFLLSQVSRQLGLPYIGISATAGGWGGRVVRVPPSGCWACFQRQLQEGTIPVPPAAESGWVEPQGCNSPTFTGAGFDTAQVSMMGVRVAVSSLCQDTERAYPTINWDVAVLSLRAPDGAAIAPKWEVFTLQRHPSCGNH